MRPSPTAFCRRATTVSLSASEARTAAGPIPGASSVMEPDGSGPDGPPEGPGDAERPGTPTGPGPSDAERSVRREGRGAEHRRGILDRLAAGTGAAVELVGGVDF